MSDGRSVSSFVFRFIEPDIGGGSCELKEQHTSGKQALPGFATAQR